MKRVLVCLLILFGFALAGCEEEEHEHHHHYAYEGHHGGYRGHEYRVMNQTTENDGILQIESTVEP
jgi:hypothetical protein